MISVAGFGRKVPWKEDQIVPAGHQMTFQKALHIVSCDTFFKLVVPDWATGLTQRMRDLNVAFAELEVSHSAASLQ